MRADRARRGNPAARVAEAIWDWEISQIEKRQNSRDGPWLEQEPTSGSKWRREKRFENSRRVCALGSRQLWLLEESTDGTSQVSRDKSDSAHRKAQALQLKISPDWGQNGERTDLARRAEESYSEKRNAPSPMTFPTQCYIPTQKETKAQCQATLRSSKASALPLKQRTPSRRLGEDDRACSATKQKSIVVQMDMVTDVVHEAAALRFGWAIHKIIRRRLISVIRHWKSAGSRPCSGGRNFSVVTDTSFSIVKSLPHTGNGRPEVRLEAPVEMGSHQAFLLSQHSASQRILVRNEDKTTAVAGCHSSDSGRIGHRDPRTVSVATSVKSVGARLLSRCLLHAIREAGVGDAWDRLKTWSQHCQFEEHISGFYSSLQVVSEWAVRFSRVVAVMALRRVVGFSARRILLRTFLTLSQAEPRSSSSRTMPHTGVTVTGPSPDLGSSGVGTPTDGVQTSGASYPQPPGCLTYETNGKLLGNRGEECYTRRMPVYTANAPQQTPRVKPTTVLRASRHRLRHVVESLALIYQKMLNQKR
ncbi:hypothetical protein TGCAST_254625 [Toxoplasma gondii CAST]|uniref:Uncharacterized protein n=1 Tax=Toxoplasma gondii CAST TaxID=943122 RepID=A0A425HRH0_TOXGO|nr:hypothetical protein TGCAST_254625 [Toxoplasma gondii CAST]